MSIKDDLKNTFESVKDALSEAGHKSTAEAERTRREVAGDTLTPGETIASVANEAKNEVQAGVDHAKVEARKEI
jgi:hypothetical protein